MSNLLITNNFISSTFSLTQSVITPLIQNNVLAGGLTSYGALVLNNIMYAGGFGGIDNTVNNNISVSNQFSTAYAPGNTYNNNQINVPYANLFVDVGMYGNTAPYILSGIPAVPAVYFLSVPATGNSASPLNVTLKVRSNN